MFIVYPKDAGRAGKLPAKIWVESQEDVEAGALKQIDNLIGLPFVHHHVAVMGDVHQGEGMPIGGVLATKRVVIPSAVGVDIGCGMLAMQTNLEHVGQEELKAIMSRVRERIPMGFDRHGRAFKIELMGLHPPEGNDYPRSLIPQEWNNACTSMGTLGSGNHFIEFQESGNGLLWVMIHSGSRNLGKKVADHYDEIAVKMNERWWSQVPRASKLAFLPLDSDEGQHYIADMDYCIKYAAANRRQMMSAIDDILGDVFEGYRSRFADAEYRHESVHNYMAIENHFGENVCVHRKGAVRARAGDDCIIPGSQGTRSYICEGKGNPESFNSCSHGAGRRMGRKEACRTLDLEGQKRMMDDMGILHSIRGTEDLDEAPGAYKDIDAVMARQADLVFIKVILTPLAVLKGK